MSEGADKPKSNGPALTAERFEEVFAGMLRRQREMVNNMVVTEYASRWNPTASRMEQHVKAIHRGTDALVHKLEKGGWISDVRPSRNSSGSPFGWFKHLWESAGSSWTMAERRRHSRLKAVSARSFSVWLGSQTENFWSNYLRFSLSFLRFVSESGCYTEKHVAMIKANLTGPERCLLFYSCLNEVRKDLLDYAIEFELFDNMSKDDFIDPSHAHLIDPRVFGPDKRGLLTS